MPAGPGGPAPARAPREVPDQALGALVQHLELLPLVRDGLEGVGRRRAGPPGPPLRARRRPPRPSALFNHHKKAVFGGARALA
jgi:hypothetical protein